VLNVCCWALVAFCETTTIYLHSWRVRSDHRHLVQEGIDTNVFQGGKDNSSRFTRALFIARHSCRVPCHRSPKVIQFVVVSWASGSKWNRRRISVGETQLLITIALGRQPQLFLHLSCARNGLIDVVSAEPLQVGKLLDEPNRDLSMACHPQQQKR
jgi:hypothetical protein